MFRTIVTLLPLAALVGIAVPASARAAALAVPADPAAPVEEMVRPLWGPILADDPATRAEIKTLYRALRDFQDGKLAEIAEVSAQTTAETDSDLRLAVARRLHDLKVELERRTMEISLDIARLNGDEPRVAEYERALEQLLDRDARPRPPVDPELERARLERELAR